MNSKEKDPAVFKPSILHLDNVARVIYFQIEPPVTFHDSESRNNAEKSAARLARLAMNDPIAKANDRVLFTHTSANNEATIGHAVLGHDNIPEEDTESYLDKASYAVESALYQTLNGFPKSNYGMGVEM